MLRRFKYGCKVEMATRSGGGGVWDEDDIFARYIYRLAVSPVRHCSAVMSPDARRLRQYSTYGTHQADRWTTQSSLVQAMDIQAACSQNMSPSIQQVG